MSIDYKDMFTPLATVLAVVLTNSLSYGRGNKEKLWELRQQAYSVILAELAEAAATADWSADLIRENEARFFADLCVGVEEGSRDMIPIPHAQSRAGMDIVFL